MLNTNRVQGQTHPPVEVHRQLRISAEPSQPAAQLSGTLSASFEGNCLKSILHSIFSHIKASSCNTTRLATPRSWGLFWLLQSIS